MAFDADVLGLNTVWKVFHFKLICDIIESNIFTGDIMRIESVAVMVIKASLEFEKIALASMAPYELTSTQFRILRYLYINRDKNIIQNDIEKFFSLTNPTVTGVLQNLEKKNYIVRKVSSEDRRARIISLTEKGLEFGPKANATFEELEDKFTAALSEEEKTQLIDLLAAIVKG